MPIHLLEPCSSVFIEDSSHVLLLSSLNRLNQTLNFQLSVMLRQKTLVQTLSQVITGGVQGTILMNREGTLLAYAGYDDKNARMVSAIASSIWSSYDKHGRAAFSEDPLESYTILCEVSIVNYVVRNCNKWMLWNDRREISSFKKYQMSCCAFMPNPQFHWVLWMLKSLFWVNIWKNHWTLSPHHESPFSGCKSCRMTQSQFR